MRAILHFHASISDSSVIVWDSERTKPQFHRLHLSKLCCSLRLSSSFTCHPGSLSVCVTVPLSTKEPITSDTKIITQCYFFIFWSRANNLNRQLCQVLISRRCLLLFLDILSQRHKRRPINPPSFEYNNELAFWQAIMCYNASPIPSITELINNNKACSLIYSTVHYNDRKQKKPQRRKLIK